MSCSDPESFPLDVWGAVGSQISSNPIICGGYIGRDHLSDECFMYGKQNTWEFHTKMNIRRAYPAGITYNNSLHIFGGYEYDYGILGSSEIVRETGETQVGLDMPIPLHFHAMASFNESMSMLIGGVSNYDSYLSLTFYYDHSKQEFKQGPELLEGRILHSAGKFLE